MKYGLKITVSRDDLVGVELTIDMPEVDRECILAGGGAALEAVFNQFDTMVNLV